MFPPYFHSALGDQNRLAGYLLDSGNFHAHGLRGSNSLARLSLLVLEGFSGILPFLWIGLSGLFGFVFSFCPPIRRSASPPLGNAGRCPFRSRKLLFHPVLSLGSPDRRRPTIPIGLHSGWRAFLGSGWCGVGNLLEASSAKNEPNFLLPRFFSQNRRGHNII